MEHYLTRSHLHPLMFDLTPLKNLDSLCLSLVQFHLDNDEPGHDELVRQARLEWRSRRDYAKQAGQRLEGEPDLPPPPPPPPPPSRPHNNSPPVPHLFVPLVETLLAAHKSNRKLLRAQVGSELRKAFPDVYSRDSRFNSFKLYAAEAQKVGIVRLKPGDVSGRDTIELTEAYRNPSSAPAPVPYTPSRPPLPYPLPPALFHLSSLSFPSTLAALPSLPSHQLLLLQFRDDIPPAHSSEGSALHLAVEAEFWRRRSAAVENGEEWVDPPAETFVPSMPPPPPVYQQQNGSLFPPPVEQPYYASWYPPPLPAYMPFQPPPFPPLPPAHDPLPLSISSTLHTLDLSSLPPYSISTLPALLSLLPNRLHPSAAILYSPTTTAPHVPPARRAHLAFRSSGVAGAAQAHLNGLKLNEHGAVYPVHAATIAAVGGAQPRWEWGDVREEERFEMWRSVVMASAPPFPPPPPAMAHYPPFPAGAMPPSVASHYAAPPPPTSRLPMLGENGASRLPQMVEDALSRLPADLRSSTSEKRAFEQQAERYGSDKKPRLSVSEQIVSPSSPVPASSLSRLYGLSIEFAIPPPTIHKDDGLDDCFVYRFHAVGWRREKPLGVKKGMDFFVLFGGENDAKRLHRWVHDTALRFWKNNGLRAHLLSVREVEDLKWRYVDFTPSWRADERVAFPPPPAPDRPHKPTVGQLGLGPDVPSDTRVGWFPFEYKLKGIPVPSANGAGPPAPGSLASRLGGKDRWAPSSVNDGDGDSKSYRDRASSPALSTASTRFAPQSDSRASSIQPHDDDRFSVASSTRLQQRPLGSHSLTDDTAAAVESSETPYGSDHYAPSSLSNLPHPGFLPTPDTAFDSVDSPLEAFTARSPSAFLPTPSASEHPSFIPAFTSALSAARFLVGTGRTKRRRTTASELFDFDEGLDELFKDESMRLGAETSADAGEVTKDGEDEVVGGGAPERAVGEVEGDASMQDVDSRSAPAVVEEALESVHSQLSPPPTVGTSLLQIKGRASPQQDAPLLLPPTPASPVIATPSTSVDDVETPSATVNASAALDEPLIAELDATSRPSDDAQPSASDDLPPPSASSSESVDGSVASASTGETSITLDVSSTSAETAETVEEDSAMQTDVNVDVEKPAASPVAPEAVEME